MTLRENDILGYLKKFIIKCNVNRSARLTIIIGIRFLFLMIYAYTLKT